jgi:hypothetical protein
MTAATAGTSVHVATGSYTEINPSTIPANVALMGDNLRSVTVIPTTPAGDLFYMSSGTYVWGITIKNYLANGFSYNPATPSQNVFVSPYIQNITSYLLFNLIFGKTYNNKEIINLLIIKEAY